MKKTILVFITVCVMSFITVCSCFADNNTIYACITKSTGGIRIVSAPTQCKSNEGLISWNVTGPAGPMGPKGDTVSLALKGRWDRQVRQLL